MKPAAYLSFLRLIVLCAGTLTTAPAYTQTVTFDFDNAPLHAPLPISQTVNGITANFSATGQGYSIQEANAIGFTPPGFSGYILYPSSVYLSDLFIRFNAVLTGFSIMYSCQEMGCDDAATMRVTTFLNGHFVGTNTITATNPGTWPVDTLSCNFPQGFDSVVVHYDKKPPTCQDYGPIFMADNMRVALKSVLPVVLAYFSCEAGQNTAILQWQPASESDLADYTVQSATDGRNFRDLARISAKGANSVYRYLNNGVSGTLFYRLKITDRDGAFTYSEVRRVNFDNPAFRLVTNPSWEHLQLFYPNTTDVCTVQILSANGAVFRTMEGYPSGKDIAVGNLPNGVYLLRVFSFKNELLFARPFAKIH